MAIQQQAPFVVCFGVVSGREEKDYRGVAASMCLAVLLRRVSEWLEGFSDRICGRNWLAYF